MQVVLRPEKHQLDAVKFFVQRPYGFANYPTGSGKSIIAILTAFFQQENNYTNKYLIVSPKSGLISLFEDFENNSDYIPMQIESLTDFITFFTSDKNVAIVNYNILESCVEFKKVGGTIKEVISDNIMKFFKELKIGVIFDEFHTLKEPKAKVTKYWKFVRPYINYCYGLTASSYFQNIEDIYHLCAFLDKKFFGTLTSFRDSYCEYTMQLLYSLGRTIPQITGYKNLDLLKFNLEKIMIYYNPELDVRYITHETFLEDKSEYKKNAIGLLKLIDTGKIDETTGEAEKALSIKTWSARLPDLQRVINASIEKKKLFSDLVLQLKDQGFIVYCNLMETIPIVKEILTIHGIEFKEITGATNTTNRKKFKNWFNADPRNKAFIISDAGGQSLNLQSVNNLVFYELPMGIGKFIQIRGRIVRQFSKHKIFNIHIPMVKETIDEYKYIRITQQQQVYSDLFGLAVANEDASFKEFNQFLLDSFKKEYLWKK